MSTVDLTQGTFEKTVQQKGIVLIDWWASWCGPCKAFAPVYEKVSRAHPEAVFAKVDTEASPELAAAFQIRAIPTLSILRDGVLLLHRAGLVSASALEDLIAQAGALDMIEVQQDLEAEQAKSVTGQA